MITWKFTIEVGDAEPGKADIAAEVDRFRQWLLDQAVTHRFTADHAPAKTGRLVFGVPVVDPAPGPDEAFPDDLIGRTP